jgi:hypothetical protein
VGGSYGVDLNRNWGTLKQKKTKQKRKEKKRKEKKRKGKERKGKERKGKERKGKERKRKERKGKERKGKERKGKIMKIEIIADDHWGGEGSSGTPTSDTYRGTAPFSEPESKAVSDYAKANGPFVG